MGLRFRKSVNFGPLRLNFSKSGVGYSVGGKGFRVTKTATGRTRTTASIPGTGISYVKETTGARSSGERVTGGTTGTSRTPTPKKPKKRKWPYIVGAVLVVGVIGSAMGGGDQDEPARSDAVSDPPAVSQVETISPDVSQVPIISPAGDASEPAVSQEVQDQKTEPTQEAQEPVGDTTPPEEQIQEPPAPTQDPAENQPVQSDGTYVGSVDSDKYHIPGCRFAKEILPENEIWFDTKEEAQAAGYSPCGVCQ